MIESVLFFSIFLFGIYFTNKSIINSYCLTLLSYLIISYDVGLGLNLFGVNYVISCSRTYLLAFVLTYLFKKISTANKNQYLKSNTDRLLLFLLIYVFLSLFWGISLAYDLKNFFSERWLLGIGAYFISKDLFRTKESIIILLKYLFLSLMILATYGIIELFTSTPLMQLPFFRSFVFLDTSFESSVYQPHRMLGYRGGLLRIEGTFWNSIIYSIALTFLYPLYLVMRKFDVKYLKMGFIPVTIVAILTMGRTAWFSIILALFFNFNKNKLLTILAICCLFFIAIPYFNENIETKSELDQSIFSINSRIYTLPIIYELPINMLLYGNGIGSYFYAVINDKYMPYSKLCGDNSLLQIIYTIGVIGAGIFLFFFGSYYLYLLKTQRKYLKNSFEYNLIKGTRIMLIIQMILFVMTNSIVQDTRLLYVFFSFLGALGGYLQSNSNHSIGRTLNR